MEKDNFVIKCQEIYESNDKNISRVEFSNIIFENVCSYKTFRKLFDKKNIFNVLKDYGIVIKDKRIKHGNYRKDLNAIFRNDIQKFVRVCISCGGEYYTARGSCINQKRMCGGCIQVIRSKAGGKKNVNKNYNKKIGIFNNLAKIKAANTNKLNNTGIFNSEFRQQYQKNAGHFGGLKGGSAAMKILRKNKKIKYKDIYFMSKCEMYIGKYIIETLNIKLIDGKNFQVVVGSKIFDFFINNIFIEFHPCNNYIHPETEDIYYAQRRCILDVNGYKNNKLIIIQDIKDINKIKEVMR